MSSRQQPRMQSFRSAGTYRHGHRCVFHAYGHQYVGLDHLDRLRTVPDQDLCGDRCLWKLLHLHPDLHLDFGSDPAGVHLMPCGQRPRMQSYRSAGT